MLNEEFLASTRWSTPLGNSQDMIQLETNHPVAVPTLRFTSNFSHVTKSTLKVCFHRFCHIFVLYCPFLTFMFPKVREFGSFIQSLYLL